MLGILAAVAIAVELQPDCKEPQTQADMNICSARDYKGADATMTRQWHVLAARTKQMDAELDRTFDKRPGYFATLLDGQRAWLKFRDAHCAAEGYNARGGSMEPLLVNSCLELMTRQRTEQLRELNKMYSE